MILISFINITVKPPGNNGRLRHQGWIVSTFLLEKGFFFKQGRRYSRHLFKNTTKIIIIRVTDTLGNLFDCSIRAYQQFFCLFYADLNEIVDRAGMLLTFKLLEELP